NIETLKITFPINFLAEFPVTFLQNLPKLSELQLENVPPSIELMLPQSLDTVANRTVTKLHVQFGAKFENFKPDNFCKFLAETFPKVEQLEVRYQEKPKKQMDLWDLELCVFDLLKQNAEENIV